jgi:hypothetical protein
MSVATKWRKHLAHGVSRGKEPEPIVSREAATAPCVSRRAAVAASRLARVLSLFLRAYARSYMLSWQPMLEKVDCLSMLCFPAKG